MSTLAPSVPLAIGSRVRALREAMDLSLRELGERAGVSAPMLSQVERGETSPTLAVAGAPGAPPMHEPGSRETAVLTGGRITLVCDGRAHDLEDGDAVTFDADLPHHFENPGTGEASFMAVVSAGLRRS